MMEMGKSTTKSEMPSFETKRLLLRPLQLSDAPAYQRNFNDYEVIRHLSHQVPWPYPEDGAAHFIKESILPKLGIDRWAWGIFEKAKPQELIGAVDFWREGCPEHRGFWLARDFWGRGYMTEALIPLMDYAFNELGFEEMVLSNAVGNEASHRLKEKFGAVLVGIRPAKFVDSQYTEHEIWRLSKEAWIARTI